MTCEMGFIGGGRITRIFLQALKNKSVGLDPIVVYDPDSDVCNNLKEDFPEIRIVDSMDEAACRSLVVLAVHPPVLKEILPGLKSVIDNDAIVLSLAPKITIAKISEVLATSLVARMIPNATSFIGKGYNPVVFGPGFKDEMKEQLLNSLKPLGKNFETSESKLEGYAIVSAMLPTYFWFQWQEMENIAVETGLSKKEARKTVKATLKRAWKLYYKSGKSPEEVMDLIPVKPIGQEEKNIREIFRTRLLGLFNKIKP